MGKRRRQPSSIDRLPEEVRVELNMAIREKRLTILQLTEHINKLLKDQGSAQEISKSAVGRYSKWVDDISEETREMQAACNAITSRLGDSMADSDIGETMALIIKTLAMKVAKAKGDNITLDDLNDLALIAQRAERASALSTARIIKIEERARAKALEDAADAVKAVGKKEGVSAEVMDRMLQGVLGGEV